MPFKSTGSASGSSIRPTLRWMLRSPARLVAFGFGSGLLRPAPGTWGTALGWALWVLIVSRLSDPAVFIVLFVSFFYGAWVCHRVGKELGRADDGAMVWDEIVAFWLVLWLAPSGFIAQLVAFIAFRAFDIIKPQPIRFFDKRWKNGFGVMWDDLLAAVYSLLFIAILVQFEVF